LCIRVTEDAYRQVKGRLDLAVSGFGPRELKNIADSIRVYCFKSASRASEVYGGRRNDGPKSSGGRATRASGVSALRAGVAGALALAVLWAG
jgi:hypothetical protein